MTNNTDPVRALIAKWRSESTSDDQSSDFECGEHSARDECANELEYALASAPPSAPEPEVHSYDPTDQRESVTIRWQDGKCLSYVLDRTRYTDNLPPSAPVGVEGLLADLETIWHSVSDDKETNAAYQRLKSALAQQPAAVDEAAAIRAFEEHFEASAEDPYFEGDLELWLTAWRKSIAAQQQGGRADG